MIYIKKYRLEYKEFGRNMSKLDILFYDIATEGNTNPVVSSVLQLFKNSKYSFPHAISMLLSGCVVEGEVYPWYDTEGNGGVTNEVKL